MCDSMKYKPIFCVCDTSKCCYTMKRQEHTHIYIYQTQKKLKISWQFPPALPATKFLSGKARKLWQNGSQYFQVCMYLIPRCKNLRNNLIKKKIKHNHAESTLIKNVLMPKGKDTDHTVV